VFIGGKSNGEDVTLVLSSIELLEWLDMKYIKKESIKYIKSL